MSNQLEMSEADRHALSCMLTTPELQGYSRAVIELARRVDDGELTHDVLSQLNKDATPDTFLHNPEIALFVGRALLQLQSEEGANEKS